MAGRPLPPPRHWSVVRVSQPTHCQIQSLIRAYELALPILSPRPVRQTVPQSSAATQSRRRRPSIRLGA
jgi:hypothetical protein